MLDKRKTPKRWLFLLFVPVLLITMALAATGAFAGTPRARISQVDSMPLTGAGAAVGAIAASPLVTNAFLFLRPSTDTPGTCPPPTNGGVVAVGCTFALDLMVNAGSNSATVNPPGGVTAQQSYLTFTQNIVGVTRFTTTVGCVLTNVLSSD